MSKIKIGWAEVDITPKEKISLAGQFFERISDEVESELKAVAMAVESGDEQMIICALDLVSVGQNLHDAVKKRVAEATGLAETKIITSAIHTHTSYVYAREAATTTSAKSYLESRLPEDMKYVPLVSGESCMDPTDALMLLIDKASEACIHAWNNRKNAYYKNAFGRVAVGMCRRVCYDDGSAKMWGDTNHANFTELEGGNDSGMELIFTFDEDKKITGVVANIACPAQVVEHRSFISSDYWGKVRDNIKKKFGDDVAVLGLCSAAGDQCPRDMIRWVNPETPIDDPNIKRENYIERVADPSMFDVTGLKLVGKRISNEIISVYEELDGNLFDEALLVHETIDLTMPLRRVTIAEYNNAVEQIDRFIERNRDRNITFEENAALHIYSGIIQRYEKQKTENTYTDEIHIIRFGDIAIATNPYELFLDYGNKIRARSLAKQTILIQLSCGARAYLPTEKAERGSHYSAYVSSGYTGHEGGDLLVRETLERINKMFKN
ncbi:MAG: hypothetical protein E7587_02710 [Ruminococcaceae bacterium]|nr:hypothetical protein [Oscillospiraceae bacterium]